MPPGNFNSFRDTTILVENVPSAWVSAWADVEVQDDNAGQTYDYVTPEGETKWFDVEDMDQSFAIFHALCDVRDFMAAQTGQTWKKVRFTVHRDGTFKTEFQYD
jgi:hypothetical protein